MLVGRCLPLVEFLWFGLRRTSHASELGWWMELPSSEIGFVSGFLRSALKLRRIEVLHRFWIPWLVSKCDLLDAEPSLADLHVVVVDQTLHADHALPSFWFAYSRENRW